MKSHLAAAFPYLAGFVWLVNGLYCKVLGQVPRHEEIVARILGEQFAHPLIIAIGAGEILIACWCLSGRLQVLNGWFQIGLIIMMNVIEFLLVRDLLLWGGLNFLWAAIYVVAVWFVQIVPTGKEEPCWE